MVGKTRLFQSTGSPLIHGRTGAPRRKVWPWVLLGLVLLAAAAYLYVTYVLR
ncbi:MAG TPA: hypothetical protein VIK83_00285 [Coriobacteriia bacterium]